MATKYILVCLNILLIHMLTVSCANDSTKSQKTLDEVEKILDTSNCTFPPKSWYKSDVFGLEIPKLKRCQDLETDDAVGTFEYGVCQALYQLSLFLCNNNKMQNFVDSCLNPAILEKLTVFDKIDVCLYASVTDKLNFMNTDDCKKYCGDSKKIKDICELYATVYYQHRSCSYLQVPKPKQIYTLSKSTDAPRTSINNDTRSRETSSDKNKAASSVDSAAQIPSGQSPSTNKTTSSAEENDFSTHLPSTQSIDTITKASDLEGRNKLNELLQSKQPPITDKIASSVDVKDKLATQLPIKKSTYSMETASEAEDKRKLDAPKSDKIFYDDVNQAKTKYPLDTITDPKLPENPKNTVESGTEISPIAVAEPSSLELATSVEPEVSVPISLKTTLQSEKDEHIVSTATGYRITPKQINSDDQDNDDDDNNKNPIIDDYDSDTMEDADKEKSAEQKEAASSNNKNKPPLSQVRTHEIDSDINEPLDNEENGKQLQGAAREKGISNMENDDAPGSGHFLAYFLTAVVICISGYIIYHNKQKILAFVIEGRNNGRGGRQRSKDVKYTQLKSNVEEVLPSLEHGATSKNFVY